MTKTIQSTVAFSDPQNNALANGLLVLDLNQPCEVLSGGGQVAPMRVTIVLNSSGQIPGSTVIYANDELSPSGTAYRARLFNSNFSLVADFGFWSIVGGSPIDLSQEVATSLNVAYPTPGLLGTAGSWTATQTFNSGKLVANSPQINGTPTGTGIPTTIFARGSGSGNYSTTSASYTDIDGTNLTSGAITVPTGWKAIVTFNAFGNLATSSTASGIAIADGTTVLIENTSTAADSVNKTMALRYVFTGDGASHTFKARYKSDGTHLTSIINVSSTERPTFDVFLTPSN